MSGSVGASPCPGSNHPPPSDGGCASVFDDLIEATVSGVKGEARASGVKGDSGGREGEVTVGGGETVGEVTVGGGDTVGEMTVYKPFESREVTVGDVGYVAWRHSRIKSLVQAIVEAGEQQLRAMGCPYGSVMSRHSSSWIMVSLPFSPLPPPFNGLSLLFPSTPPFPSTHHTCCPYPSSMFLHLYPLSRPVSYLHLIRPPPLAPLKSFAHPTGSRTSFPQGSGLQNQCPSCVRLPALRTRRACKRPGSTLGPSGRYRLRLEGGVP